MKKVLFLDFDGTLVTTVSGKTFPENALDMKLVPGIMEAIHEFVRREGAEFIFCVSNQGGIEKGFVDREETHRKIGLVMAMIETRMRDMPHMQMADFKICESNDPRNPMRKPNPGMLDVFNRYVMADRKECLMVGDASGKPGDFSDSDKVCAENFGCDYMDVNDFIREYAPEEA